MIVGGFRKLSLIDFPNHITSVIFTRGCNFRCIYCHNPRLVYPELFEEVIPVEKVMSYLKTMAGKIEAVVISGGEPTIHNDLPDLCRGIKLCGLKLKLDTNGSNPGLLEHLIRERLLDYIAMDMKADKENYKRICGTDVDLKKVERSIQIIKNSDIPHQFRTTCVSAYHTIAEIKKIKESLAGSQWVLQNYKAFPHIMKNNYSLKPVPENEFRGMEKELNC